VHDRYTTGPAQDRQASEDRRPGSRGSTRTPSADDVLIAAIELALTGAGLPQALTSPNGHATGTGFAVTSVAGAATPRAAVTWYEDGMPAGAPDEPAGKRACEQVLRRAGFRVEYTTQSTAGCLLARRGTRGR
jgi:hypothetical protein